MRVQDLIAVLEGLDGNAEVRLATQPSSQFEIAGVAVASEVELDKGAYDDLPCHAHGQINCDECWTNTLADEYGNVAWIVAGNPPRETPHASKRIFEAAPMRA